MNLCKNFTNCFSCDANIDGTGMAWSCRSCWNKGIIPTAIKKLLHEMPTHIPRRQHLRYIKRIFEGKR